jgi:AraC-like DNA-binding protein
MDQQFMEKAIKVVEDNISDHEFTVEKFSQEMAMSRVQLHRKLTALTNTSSSRFIRTIRLKRAAEFLSGQGAKVTETAYKFGFNNMSYFAKCFQEEYGTTPSAYLAEHTTS